MKKLIKCVTRKKLAIGLTIDSWVATCQMCHMYEACWKSGAEVGGLRGGSCPPWPPKIKSYIVLHLPFWPQTIQSSILKRTNNTILSLFHRFICLFKQNNVCGSRLKTKFLFFLLHVLNFLSGCNFFFPRGAFVTQLFPLN